MTRVVKPSILLALAVFACALPASASANTVLPTLATGNNGGAWAYNECAIKTDGTPKCWGYDNGSGIISRVSTVGKLKRISLSSVHACGIKLDDTVTCWGLQGSFADGQANDQDYGQANVPNDLGKVKALASIPVKTCAVTLAETVRCWGTDAFGDLSIPAGLTGVKDISLGGLHACALKTDGTVVCWGANSADPTFNKGQADVPAGLSNVKAITAGSSSTCALKTDNSVTCWGGDSFSNAWAFSPSTSKTWAAVYAEPNSVCGLSITGVIDCPATVKSQETGAYPSNLGKVVSAHFGARGGCALEASGKITCWGDSCTPDPEEGVTCPPVSQTIRGVPAADFPALLMIVEKQSAVVTSQKVTAAWKSSLKGNITIKGTLGSKTYTLATLKNKAAGVGSFAWNRKVGTKAAAKGTWTISITATGTNPVTKKSTSATAKVSAVLR